MRFSDQPGVFREKLLPQLEAGRQVFDGVRVVLVFDGDLSERLVSVAQLDLDFGLAGGVSLQGLEVLQVDDLKSFYH